MIVIVAFFAAWSITVVRPHALNVGELRQLQASVDEYFTAVRAAIIAQAPPSIPGTFLVQSQDG